MSRALVNLFPLLHLLFIIPGLLQYACRKTLADSRPRVQGRFARNAETEEEAVADHEHCNYSNFTTNNSNSNDSLCRENGKSSTWWWETPIEAAADYGHHHYQQPQLLGFDMDDDELWASLADMCSGT
jgi:hypothetical protein